MRFQVTFEGVTIDPNDFTVEEVGAIETISGVAWAIMNPLTSVLTAKAFLTVALMRKGFSDSDISERLERLTLGDLRNSFEFVESGVEEPEVDGEESDQEETPLDSTTPESSPSVRKLSGGARTKRASAA